VTRKLSRAKLIVYPSKQATFVSEDNKYNEQCCILWCNFHGSLISAEKRRTFGVRNSGVNAVVEGVRGSWFAGHMTGGRVVVLGDDFAAGMSGVLHTFM